MVEYRAHDDTEWVSSGPVTGTSTIIENLRDKTLYDVRVRALNNGNGGDWAMGTAVETGIGVNLRVLPPAPGAGDVITGDDALLLFCFTAFRNVLADPNNTDVVQIVAGSLARGAPFDVVGLRTRALVLVDGGALDEHPANLYKGTVENPSPFDRDDALLMFYALRFGNILVDPATRTS